MGFSKEQLLSRLQDLQINYSEYEHPVVLTVEAQAKHVGHLGSGLSKNLFLKDKKNRFYIISALADTKVDLKASNNAIDHLFPSKSFYDSTNDPLGCVTPFALVNESARHVSLLLDQGFKSQDCFFFHPLSNDMSISLNAADLDKFLKSIGRDPSYVDLEANPPVGKDQPPDLADLAPSGSIVLPDILETATSSRVSETHTSAGSKSTIVAGTMKNVSKSPLNAQNPKGKPVQCIEPSGSLTNVERFVEDILDRTSALLLSEITEETIKQHGGQLGAVVSNSIRSHLISELNSTIMTLKNSAYTDGFHSGMRFLPKHT